MYSHYIFALSPYLLILKFHGDTLIPPSLYTNHELVNYKIKTKINI